MRIGDIDDMKKTEQFTGRYPIHLILTAVSVAVSL